MRNRSFPSNRRRSCPECGGSGRVLLLTSRRACGRCGGTGGIIAAALDAPVLGSIAGGTDQAGESLVISYYNAADGLVSDGPADYPGPRGEPDDMATVRTITGTRPRSMACG
jgi:hypothetical protein